MNLLVSVTFLEACYVVETNGTSKFLITIIFNSSQLKIINYLYKLLSDHKLTSNDNNFDGESISIFTMQI